MGLVSSIMLNAPQLTVIEMMAALRLDHLTLRSRSTKFVLQRGFLNGDVSITAFGTQVSLWQH
jgi:hypothetical protein